MALHQPMASLGAERRGLKGGKDLVAEAEAEYLKALTDAGTLQEELLKTPALVTAAVELDKRINHMLTQDDFCVALLKIIRSWRNTLEAPQMAEDKLKRLLGPQLSAIYKKRTQAAP